MFVTWNGPEIGEYDENLKTAKLGVHFKTNNLFNTSGPTVSHIRKIKIKFNIYWKTFFPFSYKMLLLICIPHYHHTVWLLKQSLNGFCLTVFILSYTKTARLTARLIFSIILHLICLTSDHLSGILDTTDTNFLHPCTADIQIK